MARTNVKGTQVSDGSITKDDLNIATSGKAVITQLGVSNGISISSSTGADVGTGNVVIAADMTYLNTQFPSLNIGRTPNYVFAGPATGSTGVPSFRALVAGDIPALPISGITNLQTTLDAKISGSGTSGYLSKYTGSLSHGNSVVYETGGNIAIGGTSASSLLDVNGTGRFVGSVGIGSVSSLASLNVNRVISGGATSFGISLLGTVQSSVTQAIYNYTQLNTQAASFTLSFAKIFSAGVGSIGAGSSVTRIYGFHVESTLTAATNNYAFISELAAGTGRWNLYMLGTATNYMAGNVWIGTTSGTYKLDVVGDINTSTFYRIGGVRVGEWGQFQGHTQFGSFASVANWGATFINGSSTDMPNTATQWHVMKLGIGSEYPDQATYIAFGRPFSTYFDNKIYIRGIYGASDSGWLSVGGSTDIQTYTIDRGEYNAQYKGFMIEEVTGDQGVFIGKDIVNGGIMLEMNVASITGTSNTIYQNWMSPDDGRLYYISPDHPNTKKKYLIEGDITGGGGTTYTAANPLSISSGNIISISTAGSGSSGALTASDWNTFNNKFSLPGGGSDGQALVKSGGGAVWATISSGGTYSGVSPISILGTNVSIATASDSQAGALSASDWTTFNNKFNLPSGGSNGDVLIKSGSSAAWSSNFLKDTSTVNNYLKFNDAICLINGTSEIHFGGLWPGSNAANAYIKMNSNDLLITTSSGGSGAHINIVANQTTKIRGWGSSIYTTGPVTEVEIGGAGINQMVKINGTNLNFYRSSTPSDGDKFVLQYDSTKGAFMLMPM